MKNILRILPKNYLSFGFGKIAEIPWPKPFNQVLLKWFADTYKINLDEIEKDISDYRSLNDFFTRTLKAGARPIADGIVHPCDSTITEFGKIQNQNLIQAKGVPYRLIDLLRSQDLTLALEGGTYITYYLCPADYHRVHSPADMMIHSCVHIPGQLWPVNPWSVRSISNLFPRNERLVARLEIARKPAALVMVGATNVGKMTVDFDSNLVTNNLSSKLQIHEYRPAKLIKRGDPFGVFHMGSTVIMIYGREFGFDLEKLSSSHVKMGERLF